MGDSETASSLKDHDCFMETENGPSNSPPDNTCSATDGNQGNINTLRNLKASNEAQTGT